MPERAALEPLASTVPRRRRPACVSISERRGCVEEASSRPPGRAAAAPASASQRLVARTTALAPYSEKREVEARVRRAANAPRRCASQSAGKVQQRPCSACSSRAVAKLRLGRDVDRRPAGRPGAPASSLPVRRCRSRARLTSSPSHVGATTPTVGTPGLLPDAPARLGLGRPVARAPPADVVGRLRAPVARGCAGVRRGSLIRPCFQLRHRPRARRRGPPPSAPPRRPRPHRRRSPQHPADRRPHAARRRAAARQPHAEAGPVDARGVLGHVADGRAHDDRAAGGRARARASRGRRGRPRRRRPASSARRRATARARRWPGRDRRVGLAAVPGRDHAHGLVRQARPARPAAAGARGPARSRARRARPGRRRAAGRRARPAAPTSAGRPPAPTPATSRGYSSCGQRRDQRQLAREPGVHPRHAAAARAAGATR